jgi:hypothetical protein
MAEGAMLELDAGFSSPPRQLGLAEQTNWPSGRSPSPESILTDSIETRIQAGFGEEPGNIFETIPYALRVYLRRRELSKEASESFSRVSSSEARRDELLVRMAEACRSAGGGESFGSVFGALTQIDGLVKERQSALSGVSVERDAAQRALDEELLRIEAEAKSLEAELLQKNEKFTEQDLKFSRAQAQYKRILIEIRALKNAEEQARERGETLDHGPKVLELSHQAQALRPGVDELEALRTRAQKEIGQTQALIDRTREAGAGIQAQKQRLDKTFSDQLSVRQEGLRQAQDDRFAAAADAGRAILALRGSIPVDEKVLEEIRLADADVVREIKRQRTLEAAQHVYDVESYSRGRNIALSAIALFVLLILFKIIF